MLGVPLPIGTSAANSSRILALFFLEQGVTAILHKNNKCIAIKDFPYIEWKTECSQNRILEMDETVQRVGSVDIVYDEHDS